MSIRKGIHLPHINTETEVRRQLTLLSRSRAGPGGQTIREHSWRHCGGRGGVCGGVAGGALGGKCTKRRGQRWCHETRV